MERITILMSTYNGEEYLEEQLESLLSQKNADITIFVRDDGSKDNTTGILDRYQREGKLTWYSGRNLGFADSFLDLVYNAPESEYYAFSDQDDVWLPDKMSIALEKLREFPGDVPALYYGRPRLVDSELNMIKQSKAALDRMMDFGSMVTNSNANGCTMVFNSILLEKLRLSRPEFVWSHDWWVHKVCILFGGDLYFDEDVHILYRQHGTNAMGISSSVTAKIKKNLKALTSRDCVRSRVMVSLLDCYSDQMNDMQREICENIKGYQYSFSKKMKLIFDRRIHTDYFVRNVYFRISVLFGGF